MNKRILDLEVQKYITANLSRDVNKIALSKSPFAGISAAELANQIVAKNKAEKKLPSWFNTAQIYYPPALSIEQTSSEITADYKARLAKGKLLIDITGGFGIDSLAFAKHLDRVIHCEINEKLSEISQYNANVLGCKNIEFEAVNGLEFVKNSTQQFDTIYVDPARRAETRKVFLLKDCSPDIVTNLSGLLEKAERIIVKTAPLLDISAGLQELSFVSEIHIVSVRNECKELLWVIDRGFFGEPKIVAAALNEEEKEFSFHKAEMNTSVVFADHLYRDEYLYEPDAALLKTGAFNLIGNRYHLKKLHAQTQLYTAPDFQKSFPGRIFKIEKISAANDLKKEKHLAGNIIVRNFPGKPEELSKKYKIVPAKDDFFIFTKIIADQNVVIQAKIIQFY